MLKAVGDSGLKGTQEIKDILLLNLRELVKEFSYNSIRFGPRTPVLLYGAFQIFCSPIVKKKDALAEPPQGCGSKFSRRGLTLTDAVSKPYAHIVKRKVGVHVNFLRAERCDRGSPRPKRWCVAQRAASFDEERLTARDRVGPAWLVLRWHRRR